MKYSTNTVGVEVIPSMKRKIDLLQPLAAGKTIQPVLIVREPHRFEGQVSDLGLKPSLAGPGGGRHNAA